MTIADDMGFDECHSITLVSSSFPDDDEISDGDSVHLRFEDEIILVEDVEYDDEEDCYWGDIKGFEHNGGVEFEGLERGQEISFRYDHAFSRTRE